MGESILTRYCKLEYFFFVIEDVAVLQIKSEGKKMLYLVMHFAKKYIQTLLWPSKYKYTRSP